MSTLALELGGRHRDVGEALTAGYWVQLARVAESAGLDFVVVPESEAPDGAPQLDAVAIAARVAPLTSSLGLVAAATVTHTEPFHLAKAIATLDFVSHGRAGWQPVVSRTQEEADLFGRKDAAPAAVLWREAAEVLEVVARLWDSWEDDAVIRDVATGRYVDRDRLHYVDFVGEFFSVKGPSITPRSPQAQPPVVLRLDDPEADPLAPRAVAVRVSGLPDIDRARAAGAASVLVDLQVRADDVTGVPGQVAAALGRGADGVVLMPDVLPRGLRAVADQVVPALVEAGLWAPGAPGGATLRTRLGLPRPANRYAGSAR